MKSLRNKWTVWAGTVIIGAFDTKADLDDWMAADPETSVVKIPRDQLDVVAPGSWVTA